MKLLVVLALAAAWVASPEARAAGEWDDPLISLRTYAVAGDPVALTELGVRYENGEGVPKDQERAMRLYCRAARDGYVEAQFRLGWAYANGRGVARDDGIAASLFAMAAEQGHEYGAKLLAYLPPTADAPLPSCMRPDPPLTAQLNDDAADANAAKTASDSESLTAVQVPKAVRQLVERLAPEYAVDANLALAVIAVESNFNANAVSPRAAQGLMQLIPETAARFGVKRPFNPVDNIKGGLAYLRWLLAFFEGDVRLVVAAYNAGERAVEKYRGIPPYAETRDYVRKISALYPKSIHPYEPAIAASSPLLAGKRREK